MQEAFWAYFFVGLYVLFLLNDFINPHKAAVRLVEYADEESSEESLS